MQLKIDQNIYEVRQAKKGMRNDEYLLYHGNKFLCIFYLDGRSMNSAIKSAVSFLNEYNIIKKQPKHHKRKKNKRKKK